MPADLTIFAAKYLVFIDALLAALVILYLLWRRPSLVLRFVVLACLIVVFSFVFAKVGAAIYSDPRPFTEDHVKPLISHAADNGFPSDHALLAAAIVAAVAILDIWLAIPFAIIAFLVDWARVGAGIHHVGDVIGSSVFVALATLIALVVAPPILEWLAPRVAERWPQSEPLLPGGSRSGAPDVAAKRMP